MKILMFISRMTMMIVRFTLIRILATKRTKDRLTDRE